MGTKLYLKTPWNGEAALAGEIVFEMILIVVQLCGA
jgi:hypothetical protein